MMFTGLRCLNDYNDCTRVSECTFLLRIFYLRMTSTKLNKCREFPECVMFMMQMQRVLRPFEKKIMTKRKLTLSRTNSTK